MEAKTATHCTTLCTQCGLLYLGPNRKAAINENLRHGNQPGAHDHTIITEITNKRPNPTTIIND